MYVKVVFQSSTGLNTVLIDVVVFSSFHTVYVFEEDSAWVTQVIAFLEIASGVCHSFSVPKMAVYLYLFAKAHFLHKSAIFRGTRKNKRKHEAIANGSTAVTRRKWSYARILQRRNILTHR